MNLNTFEFDGEAASKSLRYLSDKENSYLTQASPQMRLDDLDDYYYYYVITGV